MENKVELQDGDLPDFLERVKFDEKGLVPAILQDVDSGEVLMLAYMNRESLQKTVATKKACFWSRSREELWVKGGTSGNFQYVESISLDCDGDTLLVQVKPAGPACHTGEKSCFFDQVSVEEKEDFSFQRKAVFLRQLYELIVDRSQNLPEESYTTYLFEEGIDKIGKKVAEEAAEVIIAGKNEDEKEIIYESADLIYHLLVLLVCGGVDFEEVIDELAERHGE
ncbi:MAG: bifunctional phosphoribosyl-AMP cyclohydrolase/phosphoribosyl-ATP diphosphatase HisIE [Bacillota bacterium]